MSHLQAKCLSTSDIKQNTNGFVMLLRTNILTEESKSLIQFLTWCEAPSGAYYNI
jgi:hypothetical protein